MHIRVLIVFASDLPENQTSVVEMTNKRFVMNAVSVALLVLVVGSYVTSVAVCGLEGPGKDAAQILVFQRNVFAICFTWTYFAMGFFAWLAWFVAPAVQAQPVVTEDCDTEQKED